MQLKTLREFLKEASEVDTKSKVPDKPKVSSKTEKIIVNPEIADMIGTDQ